MEFLEVGEFVFGEELVGEFWILVVEFDDDEVFDVGFGWFFVC